MLQVYHFRDESGSMVASRAYLAPAEPDAIRADCDELKADVALHVADMELPPGNVATCVEHDYINEGAEKVPVWVWRNDAVGGYWRAPYVDYRFDVEVPGDGEVRVAGEALPYLDAFMLATRETLSGAREAYVVWHGSKVVLERVIGGVPVGY